MSDKDLYLQKFERIAPQTLYSGLNPATQSFVRDQACRYRFTLQELRLVTEFANDLQMWDGEQIDELWPSLTSLQDNARQRKKALFRRLDRQREQLLQQPNHYPAVKERLQLPLKAEVSVTRKEQLGLGFCPVASPKTRCCNLLTLDAVDNCGYGCSYCSIQTFFTGNAVSFDSHFGEKLKQLPIDPERIYHIGTGQSSDSLMWGNSNGVLDALLEFCHEHPNVILELKTKSANISHLLKSELPPNLICTWSLNPQRIIDNEEHGAASLQKRLEAARRMADKGAVIGFHFHPMIHYRQWREEYAAIFRQIQHDFMPQQVAMISLGTLTFIKPVIKKIRQQGFSSQILKMPLVEADGKLSYPENIKLEMFSHAYRSFPPAWREQVFFYLCMENQRLWKPVFGREYTSNDAFEQAMKSSYLRKIEVCKNKHCDRETGIEINHR
ncbi:MAG: spore photoproduct lyase family protein [Pseudomonadota bacterium]